MLAAKRLRQVSQPLLHLKVCAAPTALDFLVLSQRLRAGLIPSAPLALVIWLRSMVRVVLIEP
jgi:hypothetical protein